MPHWSEQAQQTAEADLRDDPPGQTVARCEPPRHPEIRILLWGEATLDEPGDEPELEFEAAANDPAVDGFTDGGDDLKFLAAAETDSEEAGEVDHELEFHAVACAEEGSEPFPPAPGGRPAGREGEAGDGHETGFGTETAGTPELTFEAEALSAAEPGDLEQTGLEFAAGSHANVGPAGFDAAGAPGSGTSVSTEDGATPGSSELLAAGVTFEAVAAGDPESTEPGVAYLAFTAGAAVEDAAGESEARGEPPPASAGGEPHDATSADAAAPSDSAVRDEDVGHLAFAADAENGPDADHETPLESATTDSFGAGLGQEGETPSGADTVTRRDSSVSSAEVANGSALELTFSSNPESQDSAGEQPELAFSAAELIDDPGSASLATSGSGFGEGSSPAGSPQGDSATAADDEQLTFTADRSEGGAVGQPAEETLAFAAAPDWDESGATPGNSSSVSAVAPTPGGRQAASHHESAAGVVEPLAFAADAAEDRETPDPTEVGLGFTASTTVEINAADNGGAWTKSSGTPGADNGVTDAASRGRASEADAGLEFAAEGVAGPDGSNETPVDLEFTATADPTP